MRSLDKEICIVFKQYYNGPIVLPERTRYYLDRIRSTLHYSLYQGRELIKMVCRCALNDECLTDADSIAIIYTCLDPQLDNILLEVNYNEGW